MIDGWKDRLRAAVEEAEEKGRNRTEISKKAGCGPNYLQQLLDSPRSASIDKIMQLSSELGISPVYIIAGMDVSPDDQRLISKYQSFPDDLRDEMKVIFDRYEDLARLRKLADVDPPAE